MANCNDCICSEVCYYKSFNDVRALKKRRNDVEKICKSFVHRDRVKVVEIDQFKNAPNVDAIPVEDIKLHHILINNEGVPEAKLQIGERYFILYTDPVDVRKVVHGHWFLTETEYLNCSVCGKAYYTGIETWSAALDNLKYAGGYEYCPNCGAKMDGERGTYDT